METETRRSDRWAAEPAEPARRGWSILAVLAVLAGYAAAAVVAAIVRDNVELGDRAGIALVGAAPSLGALGLLLGIVGIRRGGLRWFAWIAIVLGAILVAASVVVIAAVVLALRSFS